MRRISPLKFLLTTLVSCLIAAASHAGDWYAADIGGPTPAGSTSVNGGSGNVTVTGGGDQTSATSDKGQFDYEAISGDFEFTAKMVGLVSNGTAGLMIRESLDADAKFVAINVDSSTGTLRFDYRDATTASRTTSTITTTTGGDWLRLVRRSGSVSVFRSVDGNTWTASGNVSMDLGYEPVAGLAVTGYGTSTAGSAEFSNLTMASNLPPLESSLALWLRADMDATPGTTFTWADQSGNGRHATQSTTANKPSITSNAVAGKPAIEFDGTNNYLTVGNSTGVNPTTVSVFAVAKRDAGGVDAILSKYTATASGYMLGHNGTTTMRYWVGAVQGTIASTYNVYQVFSGVYDQNYVRIWKNGTEGTPLPRTTTPPATTGSILIGTMTTSGSRYNGQIAEVLLYTDAISEAQRLEIEAYFYSKYSEGTKPTAIAPVIHGGTYATAKTVTFGVARGHRVYYTIDGTDPTTSGTRIIYDDATPPTFSETGTLKAYAVKMDHTPSAVVTAKVTIDSSTNYVSHDNLKLWLRADEGIEATGGLSNGNSVTSWRDQSGNGNDALAPSGNEPVYLTGEFGAKSMPALQFVQTTGNIDYLSVPDSDSLDNDEVTIFAVAQRTGGTTVGGIVAKHNGSTGGYYLQALSTTPYRPRFQVGNIGVSGTSAWDWNNYNVISGIFNLADQKLYLRGNGVELAPSVSRTTAAIATDNDLIIGSQSASASRFTGKIAEVLVYGTALSSEKRREIEAYIHKKYGAGTAPPLESPTSAVLTGIYASAQTTRLSAPDAAANIYYTLDGSEPEVGGSVTLSYDREANGGAGADIGIVGTTNLKAIAVRDGFANSPTMAETITIDNDEVYKNVSRSGLKLWLNTGLGVEYAGSSVTRWRDQSGFGNDATPGPAAPTYVADALTVNGVTLPAIGFSGASGCYLSAGTSASLDSSEISVFAVVNREGGSGGAVVAEKFTSGTAGYSLQLGTSLVRNFYTKSATAFSTGSAVDTSSFDLLGGTYGGGTRKLYINGGNAKDTDSYAGPMGASVNPFYIGGRVTTALLNGHIAELFVYDRELTSYERAGLDAYVHKKYGIGTVPQVPDPTINLSDKIYSLQQQIFISDGEPGCHVRYTTDGSTPTHTNGVDYSESGPFWVNETTTVKLVAYKEDYNDSSVVSRLIVIDNATDYVPRTSLSLWLRGDEGVAESSGVTEWDDMSGNGNKLTSVTLHRPARIDAALENHDVIRFSSTGSTYLSKTNPSGLSSGSATVFVVAKATDVQNSVVLDRLDDGTPKKGFRLQVANVASPESHTRTFQINANSTLSGSGAALDYEILSAVAGSVPKLLQNGSALAESPSAISISANSAALTLGGLTGKYFNGDIAEVLVFNDELSDSQRREVEAYLSARYALIAATPKVATPEISIGNGPYALARTVSFTCAESGASLHYTVDGSTPTSASPIYAGQFLIHETTHVRVIAMKDRFSDSDITEEVIDLETPWKVKDPGTTNEPVPFATTTPWQIELSANAAAFISTDAIQGSSLEWVAENPYPSNSSSVESVGLMAATDDDQDSPFVYIGLTGAGAGEIKTRIARGGSIRTPSASGFTFGDRIKIEVVGNTAFIMTKTGSADWKRWGGVDLVDPNLPELGRGLKDSSGNAAKPFRIGIYTKSSSGSALTMSLSPQQINYSTTPRKTRWHCLVEPRYGSYGNRIGMQWGGSEILESTSEYLVEADSAEGFAAADYVTFREPNGNPLPDVDFTMSGIHAGTDKAIEVYGRWPNPHVNSENDGYGITLSVDGDERDDDITNVWMIDDVVGGVEGDRWVYIGRIGPRTDPADRHDELKITYHLDAAIEDDGSEMWLDGFMFVSAEDEDDFDENGIIDIDDANYTTAADGDLDGDGWTNYQEATMSWATVPSDYYKGLAGWRSPTLVAVGDATPEDAFPVFGAYGHWLPSPLAVKATYDSSEEPIPGLEVWYRDAASNTTSTPPTTTSPVRLAYSQNSPLLPFLRVSESQFQMVTDTNGLATMEAFVIGKADYVETSASIYCSKVKGGSGLLFSVHPYDNVPPTGITHTLQPGWTSLAKTLEQDLADFVGASSNPPNETLVAAPDSILVKGDFMLVGCGSGRAHGQTSDAGYIREYRWNEITGRWDDWDTIVPPSGLTGFGQQIVWDEAPASTQFLVKSNEAFLVYNFDESSGASATPQSFVSLIGAGALTATLNGEWLAIGDSADDEVNVYRDTDTENHIWSEPQTLTVSTPDREFGQSVSFSPNGARLAVGAPGAVSKVYVYAVDSSHEWQSDGDFTPAPADDGVHAFGEAVKFVGNDRLVVGAPFVTSSPSDAPDMGYVQTFNRDSMGAWSADDLVSGGGPSFGSRIVWDGYHLYCPSPRYGADEDHLYYATPESVAIYLPGTAGSPTLEKEIFPLVAIRSVAGDGKVAEPTAFLLGDEKLLQYELVAAVNHDATAGSSVLELDPQDPDTTRDLGTFHEQLTPLRLMQDEGTSPWDLAVDDLFDAGPNEKKLIVANTTILESLKGQVAWARVGFSDYAGDSYDEVFGIKVTEDPVSAPETLAASVIARDLIRLTWDVPSVKPSAYTLEQANLAAYTNYDPPDRYKAFHEIGRVSGDGVVYLDQRSLLETGYVYRIKAHSDDVISAYGDPVTLALDANGNGVPDWWENSYGLTLNGTSDYDGDNVSNAAEYTKGTDPTEADTDGDGVNDLDDDDPLDATMNGVSVIVHTQIRNPWQ